MASTKKLTKKNKELLLNSDIIDRFHNLIDLLNFDDKLCAEIFDIVRQYVPYDIAGIFFNDSDESIRNILNFSLPRGNATIPLTEVARDEFFDEVEKQKRIYEIQCNLIDGDIVEESELNKDSFKTRVIKTFNYTKHLSGGFYLAYEKELTAEEKAYVDLILRELDTVFKLKYIYTEQRTCALIDPMTKLYTRQEFDNMLSLELLKARRYIYNFTLAIIDIDYLSKINEEYGQEFGDFILVELSTLLKRVFRRTDPVFRYGAEEIIVMMPFTPITKAVVPIERLRSAIAEYDFIKDDTKANITVSIGLCANYSRYEEPEQLVEDLGTALYRAKEGGRNKVEIFE